MSNQTSEPFHVLLVEDDADMLRLVSQQLKSAFGSRIKLHSESCSEDALAVFASFHIDIVITDLDLVDSNGFHLLRSAKEIDPLIQVIIVTGHESANAFRSALSMGADEFFVKPIGDEDLIDCVEHLSRKVARWRETQHRLRGLQSQN